PRHGLPDHLLQPLHTWQQLAQFAWWSCDQLAVPGQIDQRRRVPLGARLCQVVLAEGGPLAEAHSAARRRAMLDRHEPGPAADVMLPLLARSTIHVALARTAAAELQVMPVVGPSRPAGLGLAHPWPDK